MPPPVHRVLPLVFIFGTASACAAGAESGSRSGAKSADDATAEVAERLRRVRLDLTTPDRAIRSHWLLQEISDSLSGAQSEEFRLRPNAAARINDSLQRALRTGDAGEEWAHRFTPPSTFAREIVKVEQESETRAIVLARIRNTTPIPAGATPSPSDVETRRAGELVRYTLERDSTGWRLAQAQSHYYASDTTWHDRFTPHTPLVPTYVSP